MKPIHKIAAKNHITPVLKYIQVKNEKVYATNGHIAIIAPVIEIFGKNVIQADEEIYFDAALFSNSKLDKAISIERKDLMFTAFDKRHQIIGTMLAKSATDFKSIGTYPDVERAFPSIDMETKAVSLIGINPKLYSDAALTLDTVGENVRCTFYGENKPILIESKNTKCRVILMPCIDRQRLEQLKANA